jgi:hypothetical protein
MPPPDVVAPSGAARLVRAGEFDSQSDPPDRLREHHGVGSHHFGGRTRLHEELAKGCRGSKRHDSP